MSKEKIEEIELDRFVRSHQSRHPGESRGPEALVFWIPAFAGMTGEAVSWLFGAVQLRHSKFGVRHSIFNP